MLIIENDLTGQIEWGGEEYGHCNFASGEIFSDSEVAFEGTERLGMRLESEHPEVFLASTIGYEDGYRAAASPSEEFDMGSFDMDNEIGLDFGSSYSMGAEFLENELDLSPYSLNRLVEFSDDLTINVVDHQCQNCGSFLAAQYNHKLDVSGIISTNNEAMPSSRIPNTSHSDQDKVKSGLLDTLPPLPYLTRDNTINAPADEQNDLTQGVLSNDLQNTTRKARIQFCNTGSRRNKTIEKDFYCKINGCTKSYKSAYELRRHRLSHDPSRPHGCTFSLCSKSGQNGFARKDHLKQHMRQVHGV